MRTTQVALSLAALPAPTTAPDVPFEPARPDALVGTYGTSAGVTETFEISVTRVAHSHWWDVGARDNSVLDFDHVP